MDIPEEKSIIINAIRAKNNICVTGAAGTGKSFLLKLIREHFPYIHVTASTGIAAVNVSGVTLHSWAGIGNGSSPASDIVRFINSGPGTKIRRQIRKAKILAIDEISMISADVLDLVNDVFKMVKQNDSPFGGIQVIMLGDFYQLPPVSKDQKVDFCFNANAWQEADLKLFELTEVFRQSDLQFIQLLNNIRHAALNEDDLNLLNHRQSLDVPAEIHPTILVTHNYQADTTNREKLAKLIGEEEFTYKMLETGKANSIAFLKKNCLAQENLTLRCGAQVMMLKNTLQKQGIINGSIGIITGFTHKEKHPIVYFNNGEKCIIAPEEWNIEVFNEDKQVKEINATIKQIPLTLAWAITIHKSQGMTLDNVFCDLSKIFTEGQAYVALSRVRSLEGLYLRGFRASMLKVNQKVRDFYSSSF
jgi:ATP-dependent DNA helicase PIF1